MQAEDQDNYSSLPLEDRLTHKLWKARLEAYDELSKLFQKSDGPKDPLFRAHFEAVRATPAESNAAALESALGCLLSFMKFSDGANKARPMILPVLIEKCISATKPGVRAKCLEALLLFVELDTFEPVVLELATFMTHKQPKLIAACLSAITEIFREFGADKAAVKAAVKVFGPAFQHADKNVRAEGSNLVLELYRWIGPAVESFLEPLKPIQIKELQEQFAKIEAGSAKPKRYLKSQQSSMPTPMIIDEAGPTHCAEVASSQPISSALDPYDLAEPVKVLEKIPANFQEMVDSTKWKERKDALDELNTILKAPKLEDGHYAPLAQTLAKRLADANILVAISSANCIESMAKGLRRSFSLAKMEILPGLLERCKEKKQNVIDALRSALDALAKYSIPSMYEMVESLAPFVAHKNPQVKTECLLWLSRSQTKAGAKKDIKALLAIVIPTLEDSSPEVREASIKLVASMIATSGEANVTPFLDTVDKSKQTKIMELASSTKPAVQSAQITRMQSKPAAPVPESVLGKQRAAPPSTPAKPVASKPMAESTPARTQPSAKQARKDGPLKFRHSDDEAVSVFEGVLEASIFKGLSNANWKTRLEALDSLVKDYSTSVPEQVNCELLVRFIGKQPGWKESNFQVYQKMFQLIRTYADKKGISREAVSLMTPAAVEKVADVKIGTEASEALVKGAEYCGLGFVLEQVNVAIKAQKSPKSIAEAIKWCKTAINMFGTADLHLTDLVESIKTQIQSTNPLVRSASVALTATLRQYYGPDIRSFFAELPGPIMSTLDSEFDKAAQEQAPKPTKRIIEKVSSSSAGSQDADVFNAPAEPVNLDEMIERTELVVGGELISQLGDAKWQVRKEALDQLTALVNKAHKKVKLANGMDLIHELKGRFNDSNKNLIIQALEVTGLLGEACGPTFEKHLKIVLGGVISTLSDNKLQVRVASIKCLDSLAKSCKLASFVPIIVSSMSSDSPNLRKELLMWTAAAIKAQPEQVSKEDLIPLMSTCLTCLQDRTMEVRKASQATISSAFSIVPPEQVKKMCQEQKPAMISVLQGLIDTFASSQPAPQQSKNGPRIVGSGLFMASGPEAKASRAEKDRTSNRWNFEVLSKEISDALREQMVGHIHGPLMASLFSDEFKEQVNGLGQMETAIGAATPDEREIILWNLDLLLKYLSLRFHDTNTSIQLKCFDFMEKLMAAVDSANSRFTEHEATCFLPHFIMKAGETKDSMRARTKGLFRQLCRIYPASKLFGFLMEGLKSKNSRSRTVCLEEMQSLLTRNGLVVINPPKHVPSVAALIADRDGQVRSAALNVMVRLVGLMGDQVSKYLSELGPKELDMLEERLKHRPNPDEEEKDDQPDLIDDHKMDIDPQPAEKKADGPFSLDYDQFETRDRDRMLSVATATPTTSNRLAEATPPYPFAARPMMSMDDPLDRLVHSIQTSSDLQCIQSLQRLEEYLAPTPSSSLTPRIDALMNALCVRLHECSAPQVDLDQSLKSRLGRYVTNALVIVSSEPTLMTVTQAETLILVLSETLMALTSPQLAKFEDQEQLNRALNILLVKALENSNRNHCYHALLVLLEQAFRVPPETADAKYPEFVMKCLWKLTKQIPAHLADGQLTIPGLLLDIHNFFCALPPLEWKRRANQRLPFEELPLRTVKTILHELVVAKAGDVIFCLGQVPNAEQSFVTSYLKAMLQAAGLEIPSLPVEQQDMVVDEPSLPAELSSEEIEQRLKDICGQICSKPNTRNGLQELFQFHLDNPSAASQIDSYLEQLGSFFYKYIKRNLQQLELEHRMKHDSSNADVSTYKSKLAHMQQVMAEGGMVSADPDPYDGTVSPVRTRLESPLLKIPNSPVMVRPLPPVKDSSIVNLKERLAKLRTSNNSQTN